MSVVVPKMDDSEPGKMFVGALTRDTTTEMLREHFSRFGDLKDVTVMSNPDTNKSRGFGFVTFVNPSAVDIVLNCGAHFIDGRMIDPKRCVPKSLRPKLEPVNQPKKVFLGGLPIDMREAQLKEWFSGRYGLVTECYIMYDEKKQMSRGFGFVGFEDEAIVDRLVDEHYIDVQGKRVECKVAIPRANPAAPLMSESTAAMRGLFRPQVPNAMPMMSVPAASQMTGYHTQGGLLNSLLAAQGGLMGQHQQHAALAAMQSSSHPSLAALNATQFGLGGLGSNAALCQQLLASVAQPSHHNLAGVPTKTMLTTTNPLLSLNGSTLAAAAAAQQQQLAMQNQYAAANMAAVAAAAAANQRQQLSPLPISSTAMMLSAASQQHQAAIKNDASYADQLKRKSTVTSLSGGDAASGSMVAAAEAAAYEEAKRRKLGDDASSTVAMTNMTSSVMSLAGSGAPQHPQHQQHQIYAQLAALSCANMMPTQFVNAGSHMAVSPLVNVASAQQFGVLASANPNYISYGQTPQILAQQNPVQYHLPTVLNSAGVLTFPTASV